MPTYIFNPEHDLCMANGDRNYVPPSSALSFARKGVIVMKMLYGDDAEVIAADDFKGLGVDNAIVPWGWDARLKRTLLKHGCPPDVLPTDDYLESLRRLQHRSTITALQPHATCASTVEEIDRVLEREGRVVMKAPWSGSGRGIRFADGGLSAHDMLWAGKVIAEQGMVVVERRLKVKDEYAIEYMLSENGIRRTGLSLFETQSGVYRHNILLPDNEIRRVVNLSSGIEENLERWIADNVLGRYEGPLGVDMIVDSDGNTYVSEFNFRHTMGMVAHAYLQRNPSKHGQRFIINDLI